MKKLLKVLVNVLTFGIPLFIQSLLKSKHITDLYNHHVHVVYYPDTNKVSVRFPRTDSVLYLEIDAVSNKVEAQIDRAEEV